jgi:hypothetical protein
MWDNLDEKQDIQIDGGINQHDSTPARTPVLGPLWTEADWFRSYSRSSLLQMGLSLDLKYERAPDNITNSLSHEQSTVISSDVKSLL